LILKNSIKTTKSTGKNTGTTASKKKVKLMGLVQDERMDRKVDKRAHMVDNIALVLDKEFVLVLVLVLELVLGPVVDMVHRLELAYLLEQVRELVLELEQVCRL